MVPLDEELWLRNSHIEPRSNLIGVLLACVRGGHTIHKGREPLLEALLRMPDESIILPALLVLGPKCTIMLSSSISFHDSMTRPGFDAK